MTKTVILNVIYHVFIFFVNAEHFMMSYAEKPEDITREEWMEKLNNVHIQRADMNRLIMNYLVTGKHLYLFTIYCSFNTCVCFIICLFLFT